MFKLETVTKKIAHEFGTTVSKVESFLLIVEKFFYNIFTPKRASCYGLL